MYKRILLVEDEIISAQIIGEILEDYCEKLYFADNGLMGLEVFESKRPDLIISDIQMPVMDGIKMISKIREIDLDIPIILTTAVSKNEKLTDNDLKKLNIKSVLIKPIDFDELITHLESV